MINSVGGEDGDQQWLAVPGLVSSLHTVLGDGQSPLLSPLLPCAPLQFHAYRCLYNCHNHKG